MIALIAGLLSGFVISIPPGPVAAYAISVTLTKGLRTGLSIGIGVALVDTLFCLAILFASSAILASLGSFSSEYPTAALVGKCLVIGGILVFAILQIIRPAQEPHASRIHLEDRVQSSQPMIIGSATALSNAFNPTFLPSLTALLTSLTTQFVPQVHTSFADKWFFALGFGVGTYGWFYCIIRFVAKHHARISPTATLTIRRAGGVIFIVFAIYLGLKLLL